MQAFNFNAGNEALRCLSIAEKLLSNRDYSKCKVYASRARESDPRMEQSEQMIAIADTLIAGERRLSNEHVDWYGVLQVESNCCDSEIIGSQYRRLCVLLNPSRNRFAFAENAYKLVNDAWLVLSNPCRKFEFDSLIRNENVVGGGGYNFIQQSGETQQQQQHNGSTHYSFIQEHSEQLQKQQHYEQQFLQPFGEQQLFPNQRVEYVNEGGQQWSQQQGLHWSQAQQQQQHWSQVQPEQGVHWSQQQQQQQQPLPWQSQPQQVPPQQSDQQWPQHQQQQQQQQPLPWHQARPQQPSHSRQQKHFSHPTPTPPPRTKTEPQPPMQQPLPWHPSPHPQTQLLLPKSPPPHHQQQPLPRSQLYQPVAQQPLPWHQSHPQHPFAPAQPQPQKPLRQPTPPPDIQLTQLTPSPQNPIRQPTHPPNLQPPVTHLSVPKLEHQPQEQHPILWHQSKPQQASAPPQLQHPLPQSSSQQPLPRPEPSLPKAQSLAPQPMLKPVVQSPLPNSHSPFPGSENLQQSPKYQTEIQSEPQPQSQPPAQVQSQLLPQPQSQLLAEPQSQPQSQLPAQVQSQLLPQPQSQLLAEPQSQPQSQPQLQSQPQSQPQLQSQPQGQPQLLPQPQLQPQPESQPKTQPKPKFQPQPQKQSMKPPVESQDCGESGNFQELGQQGRHIGGEKSKDNDGTPHIDVSSFWTGCPYCYNMYEYPGRYAGCTLRCQNCKRAFHAAKVSTPPGADEGNEGNFCSWAIFPLGVSTSYIDQRKAAASTWTPISNMFVVPQEENHCHGRKRKNKRPNIGPWIYIDDDEDYVQDAPLKEDSDDEDWHITKKKKNSRSPKGKSSTSKKAPKVDKSKKVNRSKIGNSKPVRAAQEGEGFDVPNVEVASKKAASVITRNRPGVVVKDMGKLDLNVEFSNEAEEPAKGTSGGSTAEQGVEDNAEQMEPAFFDGLDEFLGSLPILSVDGDNKVKAG